jgi:prevent-host-death family protein
VENAVSATTMSSREFNQLTSEAKKASASGPVFITDRGRPSHVLLNIDEYRRLTGGYTTLLEAIAMKEHADDDLETPRVDIGIRPAELDD